MIYLDTETAGLCGPTVIVQYADETSPVSTWHFWHEPAGASVKLIERLFNQPICAWNAVFDLFHLMKTYSVLSYMPPHEVPDPQRFAAVERCHPYRLARPASVLDLWLHAIRGPLQSLMEREPIRIRRVPTVVADVVVARLLEAIPLDAIYFSRSNSDVRWKVFPDAGDPEWCDIVLRFRASTGLKATARHLLGVETIDIPVPADLMPDDEIGWRPYGSNWPDKIERLAHYWRTDETAIRYAEQDVELLRDLWVHFGRPSPGDDDSALTAAVAWSRWVGFDLDVDATASLRAELESEATTIDTRPAHVLATLREQLGPIAGAAIQSTNKATLSGLAGKGNEYAAQILSARRATKRIELLDKLLQAGRFHPSLRVVGTLSGRMSGSDGLNPQGIPSEERFRRLFPLGDPLSGGDFGGFEVSIAAAVWPDANLTAALQSGKKFHGLFGASLYGRSYDDIVNDRDAYRRSKGAAFATFYGAAAPKLAQTLGLSLEDAEAGLEQFARDFPSMSAARGRTVDSFTLLSQPGGIGTRVIIRDDAAEWVENLFGRRRYFTLETEIVRAMFQLSQQLPAELRGFSGKYKRRDRLQTPGGCVASALYAAAFAVQGANQRAAANHQIQSTGADVTKNFQRRIWDATGARTLQIHDELLVVHEDTETVASIVEAALADYRHHIPLLEMDWRSNLESWASVK